MSFLFATCLAAGMTVQEAGGTELPPEVVVAQVAGEGRGRNLRVLQRRFAETCPGYGLTVWDPRQDPVTSKAHAVSFVQSGTGTVAVEGDDPVSVRVGDIILERPGVKRRIEGALELVRFSLPESQVIDPVIPDVIRPDFDPKLTDRPGGCATDPGAYRRLLLTWNPERGPYVHHGFNCHRVRIDDSFSHYHPVEGGFDEFYLVQEAPEGAVLLTSRRTDALLAGSVQEDELEDLIEPIPLQAGQLIMIPRGVTHRGLGGAVVQVLAVPGFMPGQEIPMDAAIRRVNGRFALTGGRALPVHAE